MATYFGGLYESRTGGYYFRFPDFIDYLVPPTSPTVKGAQRQGLRLPNRVCVRSLR